MGNQSTEGQSGTETKTLTSSNYKLVLLNDELHTYDYVVEMLIHICELPRQAAFRCAVEVDLAGRTIVYYGSQNSCQDKCRQISDYGPDHRMPHSMGSMRAEVESF